MPPESSRRAEEDALRHGIVARHERMANGEVRFRLLAKDGTGYVRTHSGESGASQNSHYHKTALETYVVQRVWAAFAELADGEVEWHVLRPGDVYTTHPGVAHNIYLPANAIIHTVKHGEETIDGDWQAAEELDLLTKHVGEEVLLGIGIHLSRGET